VIAAAQVWPRLMGCINSILMQVLYQGHRQRSSYALFLLRSAVHSPFLQAGKHSEKRESYGHSLIVDPWGTVLTRLNGSETGIAVADLDFERLEAVRQKMPIAHHRQKGHKAYLA